MLAVDRWLEEGSWVNELCQVGCIDIFRFSVWIALLLFSTHIYFLTTNSSPAMSATASSSCSRTGKNPPATNLFFSFLESRARPGKPRSEWRRRSSEPWLLPAVCTLTRYRVFVLARGLRYLAADRRRPWSSFIPEIHPRPVSLLKYTTNISSIESRMMVLGFRPHHWRCRDSTQTTVRNEKDTSKRPCCSYKYLSASAQHR